MVTTSATPDNLAAVYLRISLDQRGDGLAVERQRETCMALLDAKGWTLYDVYVDKSKSAYAKNVVRSDYNRLVEDAQFGKFRKLICYDLDRLTRQPRQLEDWIDLAEETGFVVVTANGEADLSTDNGKLFARIKASVARGEAEMKARRQRDAARQRAQLGRPPLGPRLTGYLPDGTVVPAEAEVVRLVFDRFSRGDSLRSVAAGLTTAGIPTRTQVRAERGAADGDVTSPGRWNPSSVVSLLRNPRYAGLAIYNGELTGELGAWEALVSEDVWRLAQSRLDDPRRKSNRVGTDRKHLGAGLYLCSECHRPVTSWSGDRYRCPECRMTRSGPPVDRLVLALVAARLRRPDIVELLAPADDEDAARTLDEEATALRTRVARFEADYDDGVIDGRRFRAAVDKANASLAEVERRRLAMLGGNAAARLLTESDPGESFLTETLMVQRQVIDALVRILLVRQPQGRRGFDPESVVPEWVRPAGND